MERPLIDSLRAEHDDLRLALTVLARMAQWVEAGCNVPPADATTLLRYLRDFVLGVHFAKENRTLLPSVVAHGGPADVQTAGAILRCQESTRQLVHALILFWEPDGALTDGERQGFAYTARALVRCLAHAMQLEEGRLFPATASVPADDRLGWPPVFAAIDAGRTPASAWRQALTALIRSWC